MNTDDTIVSSAEGTVVTLTPGPDHQEATAVPQVATALAVPDAPVPEAPKEEVDEWLEDFTPKASKAIEVGSDVNQSLLDQGDAILGTDSETDNDQVKATADDDQVFEEDPATANLVAEEVVTEAVISIYKDDCLRCTHLVPAAEKRWSKCHYSRGNDLCPAASVKIIKHFPLAQIVRNFMRAEAEGDMGKLSKLFAVLAGKPEYIRTQVMGALAQAKAEAGQS